MSGPLGSINPSNSEWAGGSITRAGQPTGVGGAFTTPSASGGPPPSFGTPATAFARNDRGSNIRIPYARVVPMNAKDRLIVDDPALTGTGRVEAYEYDGLEAGELAWIMSKQFKLLNANGVAADTDAASSIVSAIDMTSFSSNINNLSEALTRTGWGPNGPAGGMGGVGIGPDGAVLMGNEAFSGYGPDRMQRLAYTRWVEALFRQRVGRQSINLRAIQIATGASAGPQRALDSELDYYSQLNGGNGPLAGSSLFCVPDLAYGMQTTRPGDPLQVPVPMMQGLNIMEQGPFLRSFGTDHYPVRIGINGVEARAGRETTLEVEVDRHLGSSLAQAALLTELKRRGILNWTPDGITLSKFETGPDGMADAEFDSRTGQLFNVGIQGPCITKTWCNDPEMAVLPMDKVFILVVADVAYQLGAAATAGAHTTACAATTANLAEQRFAPAFVNPDAPVAGNDYIRPTTATGIASIAHAAADKAAAAAAAGAAVGAQVARSTAYATAPAGNIQALQLFDLFKVALRAAEAPGLTVDLRRAAVEAAQTALDNFQAVLSPAARAAVGSTAFRDAAEELRRGNRQVADATMMNFRLLRATSSWLNNRSHFKATGVGNEKSRCGLKIGYNAGAGVAEYIVGGWCIGTVIDSAASRALGHNGVRTAPATMAINVNVNVEWWDADKLYQNYQDRDRGIYGPKGGDGPDAVDIVQKSEGTTYMRTQNGAKTLADFGKEMESRGVPNSGTVAVQRAAAEAGTNDFEGGFKRPNPYGLDSDAVRPVASYRDGAQPAGTQGNDVRVWGAALADGSADHVAAVRA